MEYYWFHKLDKERNHQKASFVPSILTSHQLLHALPCPYYTRSVSLPRSTQNQNYNQMTLKPSPSQANCNALYPPSMPWKLRLIFKIGSAMTDASRRSNGTINRRLLSFISPHASASLHPSTGVRTSDITINPSHNLRIRVFVPASPPSTPLPVIVFFHGGGFAYLSAMSHVYDAVCRRFSRKIGAVVVSVDYRLSPEHRYPAPYDDGMEVLRYLDSGGIQSEKVMEGIKMDSSSCFLMGDSAGANIAHHVARRSDIGYTFYICYFIYILHLLVGF